MFDQLRKCEGEWVRRLLALPTLGSGAEVSAQLDLSFVAGGWGSSERGLVPPVSLLSWLVRNLPVKSDNSVSDDRRAKLIARDPDTIAEALLLLRTAGIGKGWHVFEGPTYPDALLETPDALIVVEGKRTESGPTTKTKWMPERHQIWRHLDAAWELRGRRQIFGFFIVEGTEPDPMQVSARWREAAALTLLAASLDASLPHRSELEREGIRRAFLGVATWQSVCATFGLDFNTLPDRV